MFSNQTSAKQFSSFSKNWKTCSYLHTKLFLFLFPVIYHPLMPAKTYSAACKSIWRIKNHLCAINGCSLGVDWKAARSARKTLSQTFAALSIAHSAEACVWIAKRNSFSTFSRTNSPLCERIRQWNGTKRNEMEWITSAAMNFWNDLSFAVESKERQTELFLSFSSDFQTIWRQSCSTTAQCEDKCSGFSRDSGLELND